MVEAVVQKQLEAYNRRDIEEFVSVYALDAELYNFAGMKKVASGHQEIRQLYGRMFSENPHLHCEVRNRKVLGSFVVDQEFVTGFSTQPNLDAVAIYEVQRSLIVRVWLIK